MARTTRTTTTKPGLMSRLGGNKRRTQTTTSKTNPITGSTTTKTTKTAHPHSATHTTGTHANHTTTGTTTTHHRRKPSIGDKISGSLMKLRGSITRRPGLKAAGTRRMHGTDGRGSHHAGTTTAAY